MWTVRCNRIMVSTKSHGLKNTYNRTTENIEAHYSYTFRPWLKMHTFHVLLFLLNKEYLLQAYDTHVTTADLYISDTFGWQYILQIWHIEHMDILPIMRDQSWAQYIFGGGSGMVGVRVTSSHSGVRGSCPPDTVSFFCVHLLWNLFLITAKFVIKTKNS